MIAAGFAKFSPASQSVARRVILGAVVLVALGSLQVCGSPRKLDERWQRYIHRFSSIQINNHRLDNLLGSILGYQFHLPEAQLRRGMVYTGANHRLRNVVRDLMLGTKTVKITVIGGSISWGHGASERGKTDWFSLVSQYITKAFPKAQVILRNGCLPGTPSGFMVLCLELSVDPDVDLVFTEYIINDFWADTIVNDRTATYERLVRRVLSLPGKPALVQVQVPAHGLAFPKGHASWKPFHMTLEDVYGALSQYYDLPWLSFRSATYRLANFKGVANFSYEQLMVPGDHIHLSDRGFQVVADLVVWLLQRTAMDLLLRPLDDGDTEQLTEALPEPMYPGNHHPTKALCAHQDRFTQFVVEARGFEFINEGTEEKPKKGYVATKPGSVLYFKVNTTTAGDTKYMVPVMISHLKSYENMGMAIARCENGCACGATEIDSHHKVPVSQSYFTPVQVSQHEECIISVTVSDTTSSGGHKVKIDGVMMADGMEKSHLPHIDTYSRLMNLVGERAPDLKQG